MTDINLLSLNEVDYDDLFKYISSISQQFHTPLDQKTSLDEYPRKLIANGDGYIARNNENIAGMIAGYNNNILTKEAYISLLFVSRKFRGHKIGNLLLDAFLNKAKRQGMQKAVVYTNMANIEALGLYEKHGFIKQLLRDNNDYLLNKIL